MQDMLTGIILVGCEVQLAVNMTKVPYVLSYVRVFSLAIDNASVQLDQLDERVVSMYKSIRQILQKYRSGKLPKAFKVIPALRNWEQVKI